MICELQMQAIAEFRSIFGHIKDRHAHDLDAAIGKLRQLGEPFLDIGHRVMRVEIRLAGENFVEDKWPGLARSS